MKRCFFISVFFMFLASGFSTLLFAENNKTVILTTGLNDQTGVAITIYNVNLEGGHGVNSLQLTK